MFGNWLKRTSPSNTFVLFEPLCVQYDENGRVSYPGPAWASDLRGIAAAGAVGVFFLPAGIMEAGGVEWLESLYQATSPNREDRLVSNLAFQTLRKVGFGVEDIRKLWKLEATPGLSQYEVGRGPRFPYNCNPPLAHKADTGVGCPFSARLRRSWDFDVIHSGTHVRRFGKRICECSAQFGT